MQLCLILLGSRPYDTVVRIKHEIRQALSTGAGAITLLGGCDLGSGKLGVTGGDPVTYLCEQNQKVQVRYFSLSDESLNFVKLSPPRWQGLHPAPGGFRLRRPLYRRSRGGLVEQGQGGFVEMRDDAGEWQSRYNDCKEQ